MKTQDINRTIAARPGRAGGDAPSLGRVARLRGADGAGGGHVRRSGRRGSSSHSKAITLWSWILSITTLIVIGLTVSFWLLPYVFRTPSESSEALFSPGSSVRIASKFPSPSREQSLELVKRAIANRDPAQLPSLFRMGGADRSEILAFLDASDQRDGLVDRYEWLSSMDVNGLLMEGVLVVYKGREKAVERLAFLTPDEAGNWKMDFDAFARTVSPSWKDLLEKNAQQALLRVFVGPDVYYNGPFSDDKQWVCYGLASPDTDALLRGYCKVDSTLAAAMARLFPDGQKLSRATLEVRRVAGGGARQFEIVRLVAEDWVVAAASKETL